MGTTASSCIQLRCFQSSLSFSLPPVCLMWTVKDLLTLLHLHHPLLLSTQHHLQFRIIIQTLARAMLGATASTRTPTATRWRRSSSRTSASHTVEFNCKRGKTTKNDGYGQKEVVCTRTPKQDCYNIPRKIQVEVCKTDVHRYCEKFSNIFPFPVEKQN